MNSKGNDNKVDAVGGRMEMNEEKRKRSRKLCENYTTM